MEISQIRNWDEVDKGLDTALENLIAIMNDTETDLYGYFEAIKVMNDKEVKCPRCGLDFHPIELGIDPQKTLEDWKMEIKCEEKAMDFEDIRSYVRVMMKSELLHTVLSIQQNPTNTEAQLIHFKKSIVALQSIAEIINDVAPASKRAQNKEQLISILIEALEDIRKSIIQTTQ